MGRVAGAAPIALATSLWLTAAVVTTALAANALEQEGAPAPPAIVAEIRASLAAAVQRFESRDVTGVLARVSERYRTGPLTKPVVREQLLAIYSLYDAVTAKVRLDNVRIVGDQAWVFTTGELSGRLRMLGTWTPFLTWQRELEVARKEDGTWRLFGYQQ
jgi:hypothetical protein